jgi:tripeptide aminopeptidase
VKTSALERFLRYVRIDTRADETSEASPSTPGQRVVMDMLADEMRALGLTDVVVDE